MSKLINRNEDWHVNVKGQDTWWLKEDGKGHEAGTIVLSLNPHNAGCGPPGKLYVNGISLAKLEELRSEIELFLSEQKMQLEQLRQQQDREGLNSKFGPWVE